MKTLLWLLAVLVMTTPPVLHAGPAAKANAHRATEHIHDSATVSPLGFSLTKGWLDPWPHSHFSRRGTPFVHLFTLEPAFLDRDLFLDVVTINRDDGKEFTLGVELEWALTRRIGMVIEVPYSFFNPNDGPALNGASDLAIAPRLLLVETERFLLALNTELEFPTGRETAGLSAGEIIVAPSLSAWVDLGAWVTAGAQVGVERGLETESTELFYRASLMWSFRGPAFTSGAHAHDQAHSQSVHYPPGLLSLTAELDARTPLNGEDEGISTGEVTVGVTYGVTESLDVRAGYLFPAMEPKELRDGWVFGVVFHF